MAKPRALCKKQAWASSPLSKSDALEEIRVLLLPPIRSRARAVHVLLKQSATSTVIRIFRRQRDVGGGRALGGGIKVGTRDVNSRYLSAPLRAAIPDVPRLPREVRRRHREYTPQRLERWRWCEYRILTSLSDLPSN